MGRLLIYGAYGYSGPLVVQGALRRGLAPIVAGRDVQKTLALAGRLGLEHRAFSLDDRKAIVSALDDVGVVLNCAGPFSRTAKPMVDACLERGAHYLDINGEWAVIEALAARDADFAAAGIMVMPSTGMDVVPSDCLAAHVKARLPSATRLELCIRALEQLSRGTANTFVESLGGPNRVRENGVLVERPAARDTRVIELDGRRVFMIGLPWGDIATAWYTTGIAGIAVYLTLPAGARPFLRFAGRTGSFWQSQAVQRFLKRLVQRLPEGPDEASRARGRADFIASASDPSGRRVRAHLVTPEGYALTGETASEIARRVLQGEFVPGFRTPAAVYGPDFILGFDGVQRVDLDP